MKGWKESSWRNATIASTALFVLAIVGLIFVVSSNRKSAKLAEESWQSQMQAADEEMASLHQEYLELEDDFTVQVDENDSLHVDMEERLAQIEELKTKIANAQSQLKRSKKEASEMRTRLAQLEELKTALEADMIALQEQNAMLEQTSSELRETVIASQMEIDNLNAYVAELTTTNEGLERRIAQIAPAGFTAENFVITAHRKNNKLTSKASRTSAINVSFDLDHVPAQYDRQHKIYLVVTDFQGMPIEGVPTKRVTIKNGDQQWPVEAADVESLKVNGEALVAMTITPENDLEPGSYNLLVYADNGFLGATGFQLQ